MVWSHGSIGMAALRLVRRTVASRVPPPPIEWPDDAEPGWRRPRLFTELVLVRKSSAASISVARAVGWSLVELVLIVNTTKPNEASRGPSHEMALCVSVKPGAITIAANVPWLVSVGK